MKLIILLLFLLFFAKWIAIMLVFPWLCLLFRFRKKQSPLRKLWAYPGMALEKWTVEGVSRFVIINIGYIPSISFRKLLYRLLGVSMGPRVTVHYRTEIRAPHNLRLGTGTIIGDNAILDARNGLSIGCNVNISSNVSIYTEQHDYNDELLRCTKKKDMSVTIGDRVWLGCNVIILPGVKVGEGAVCCAGCVVTKDVAPFDVVAGIPARQVNTRSQDLKYELDESACWFY